MLEIIRKLDAGTVRGLIAVTIPLLVLIASMFGLDEAMVGATLEGWAEKLIALVALGGAAYAAYARVFLPTPPLTEMAAKRTLERLGQETGYKEGGFARVGLLALILALTVALGGLLTTGGCSALGLPQAKTFNERLAAGYTVVTAVRETTGVWLDGEIRAAQAEPDPERQGALIAAAKADAQNIQNHADEARRGLDVARSLKGLNIGAAEERLASTLRILEALQKYLEGRT